MRQKTNRPRDGWAELLSRPGRPARLQRARAAAQGSPAAWSIAPSRAGTGNELRDAQSTNAAAPGTLGGASPTLLPPPPVGLPQKHCAQADVTPQTLTPRAEQPRLSMTCPATALSIPRAPAFVLPRQSAALIINSCCKQIQSLFSPSLPVILLCQLPLPEPRLV